MVRKLLIVAVLVAALGGTAASQKPDPGTTAKVTDPSGIYLCEGMNPDGNKYRGIVQIAAVRNTFLVKWTLADDVEVMGVGILQNDTLSVSYFGGTPAVVVYKIGAEKLVGEWTMGGTEGRLYAETLTRMPADQLPQVRPQPGRRPSPPPQPAPGTISL